MDEKDAQLEQYLQEQSEDGRSVGDGTFTLDSAKARVKLGQFAFPEPGLWVVKIFQAAVAAGVSKIDFKFLRREVQVRFENIKGWKASAIYELLLEAKTPPENDLMHLQAGLLSVASDLSESVSWSCGGEKVVLGNDCGEVCAEDDSGDIQISVTRPNRSAYSQGLLSSPVRYLFKQTAHEYKALVERCRCSPIPITLDGYLIPRHYGVSTTELPKQSTFDSETSTGSQRIFAISPFSGQSETKALGYPLVEDKLEPAVRDLRDGFVFSGAQFPPAGACDAILVLHTARQYRSRCNFLVDGALIEQEALADSLPFGEDLERALADSSTEDFLLDLYVQRSASDLDLSHFQIKDGSFGCLRGALCECLREVLTTLDECCERPWEFQSLLKMPKGNIRNLSIGGALTAGFLSLFVPHVIIFGGISIAVSPITKRMKAGKDRKDCETLRARVARVLAHLEGFTAQSDGHGA